MGVKEIVYPVGVFLPRQPFQQAGNCLFEQFEFQSLNHLRTEFNGRLLFLARRHFLFFQDADQCFQPLCVGKEFFIDPVEPDLPFLFLRAMTGDAILFEYPRGRCPFRVKNWKKQDGGYENNDFHITIRKNPRGRTPGTIPVLIPPIKTASGLRCFHRTCLSRRPGLEG